MYVEEVLHNRQFQDALAPNFLSNFKKEIWLFFLRNCQNNVFYTLNQFDVKKLTISIFKADYFYIDLEKLLSIKKEDLLLDSPKIDFVGICDVYEFFKNGEFELLYYSIQTFKKSFDKIGAIYDAIEVNLIRDKIIDENNNQYFNRFKEINEFFNLVKKGKLSEESDTIIVFTLLVGLYRVSMRAYHSLELESPFSTQGLNKHWVKDNFIGNHFEDRVFRLKNPDYSNIKIVDTDALISESELKVIYDKIVTDNKIDFDQDAYESLLASLGL
jgi:hypothetical protein